jgi:putative ABC transport system ATP-binding protein
MISFKNVSKSFILNNQKVEALSNINLDIKEGELVVLKGISGSGKSTLISLMAALSKPSVGEIIVDNKEIAKLSDDFSSAFRNTTIGLIFQKFNLFEDLTVLDNIVLPLYPKNLDKTILLQKANSLLKKFYLDGKSDIIVKKLSGGEQQRVAIVRALISDAPIIIADEPTANLDKKLSLEFIEIMKQLKNMGKTIIIATHDPLFFELDFVDRYIELSNGKQI